MRDLVPPSGAPLSLLFVLALVFPSGARAAQGAEVWLGGGASGGAEASSGGVAGTSIQAEVDARLATPSLLARVDLDVHLDPNDLGAGPVAPWPPEWAMLQVGRGRTHVRLGVTNLFPDVGYAVEQSGDLRAGATFGEICERFADQEPSEAAHEAGGLLARWVEDGVIASFRRRPS